MGPSEAENLPGAGSFESFAKFFDSRAGGADVIDDENDFSFEALFKFR